MVENVVLRELVWFSLEFGRGFLLLTELVVVDRYKRRFWANCCVYCELWGLFKKVDADWGIDDVFCLSGLFACFFVSYC